MATKTKEVSIAATKEAVFGFFKSAAPGLFGVKTYQDVAFFNEDPDDATGLLLSFLQEPDGSGRLKQEKIRETKANAYALIDAGFPGVFGGRPFADVAFFSEQPTDNSKLLIVWNEEAA